MRTLLIPESPAGETNIRYLIVDRLLRVTAVLGLVAYIPGAILSVLVRQWGVLVVDTLAMGFSLFLSFSRRAPYKAKALSLFAIYYLLGAALLAMTGPFGAGHLFLFAAVFLVALIRGIRDVVMANLICALTYVGLIVATSLGLFAWPQPVWSVAVTSASAVLIGGILSVAANSLIRAYEIAAEEERRLRRQRETMVREVEHRLKNNLQIVSSLVSIRSSSQADPERAFEAIQQCLRAVALANELLDRRDSRYLVSVARLLESLSSRFGAMYPRISFEFAWTGPELETDSPVAVDIGVMVNEILVNSAKHAFGDDEKGRVRIEGRAEEVSRRLDLVVGDEGRGLPAERGAERGAERVAEHGAASEDWRGQGRNIIAALSKHLGASLRLEGPPGLTYRFSMIIPEAKKLDEQD